MREFEKLQEAVNEMGGAIRCNAELVAALVSAKAQIEILKEGMSTNSHRYAYKGAVPIRYVDIADTAMAKISEVLAK